MAKEGAAVASPPAKAAAGRDFVITMLATPEAIENRLRLPIELMIAASGTAKNVKR